MLVLCQALLQVQTGVHINLQLQLYDFNYYIFNAISEH